MKENLEVELCECFHPAEDHLHGFMKCCLIGCGCEEYSAVIHVVAIEVE